MNVYSHPDFEELIKDEENQKCFDCGIITENYCR